MAQKTRKDLIDDLQLRLTRVKPSNDFQPTKKLLGKWIDDARDAFVGDKLRQLSRTHARPSGTIVESDSVTLGKGQVPFSNYVTNNFTLSKPPLYIASDSGSEPSIITAVLHNRGSETRSDEVVTADACISQYTQDNIVVLGGRNGDVKVSLDGGESFSSYTLSGATGDVLGVHVFKDGTIWAYMAEEQATNELSLYYSTNLGTSWTEVTESSVNDYIGSWQFKSGDKGILVQIDTGAIYYIDEIGGDEIRFVTMGTTDFEGDYVQADLKKAIPIDKSNIWIVANGGKVWRSTEGISAGSSGTSRPFKDVKIEGATGDILDADFADEWEGIVLVQEDAAYWTMDGGQHWTAMTTPTSLIDAFTTTHKVYSYGKGVFYIIGGSSIESFVYKTEDYGTTWEVITSTRGNVKGFVDRGHRIDILHQSGNNPGILTRVFKYGINTRQPISIVNPGFVHDYSGLRFTQPKATSPVAYREGSATSFVVEGISEIDYPSAASFVLVEI